MSKLGANRGKNKIAGISSNIKSIEDDWRDVDYLFVDVSLNQRIDKAMR